MQDLGLLINLELSFTVMLITKLLGLVLKVTSPLSSLDCILMLYFTLVRPKLEYASVIRNSITFADASKLEGIQRKFAALFYNRFFPNAHANALEYLKLRILRERNPHICAVLCINVYFRLMFCSFLEPIGIRVPTGNLRDIPVLTVRCPCRRYLSARGVSVAKLVCTDFIQNEGQIQGQAYRR